MNLTDLPELMRERSAHDPAPVLADGRMAAIRRKVTATRRRRAAGAVGGLVLLMVAVATLPAIVDRRADHPSPGPASTIDGFPVYADGGQLVAHGRGAYGSGGISLTATAGDLGLVFTGRCPALPTDLEIDLEIVVNSQDAVLLSCGTGGTYGGYSPAFYPGWHVTPGQSVTFVFTPEAYRLTPGAGGQTTDRTPTALPDGTFSVAVYQQLAFADYPLPPRPKTLPTLNIRQFDLGSGTPTTAAFDPSDGLTPKMMPLTLPAHCTPDCLDLAVTSQTPGEVDIRINGTLVSTARFWDYDGSGTMVTVGTTMQSMEAPYGDLHLTPGSTITVTLTPRYLTGSWWFAWAPAQ